MLLAVDIGNTNIHNGIFDIARYKGMPLKKLFQVPTYTDNIKGAYKKGISRYLKNIEKVIVVSVVPSELKRVEKALIRILKKEILIVGRDIDSGVKNLYKKPRQVGQDRLVNARAAFELYGGESIVVDFGTAITIDCINARKEYLGGVIVPGVELSVKALSEKAMLLPRVEIKKPGGILGRETKESMISGAVYGFSSLCDGVVRKLKKWYCKKARVIATGGMAKLIGPYCESVDIIDSDLTLKGLAILVPRNISL